MIAIINFYVFLASCALITHTICYFSQKIAARKRAFRVWFITKVVGISIFIIFISMFAHLYFAGISEASLLVACYLLFILIVLIQAMKE
ncbi:MAG: hypothetical protein ACRC5H_03330 [Treponemataceae bacterium]